MKEYLPMKLIAILLTTGFLASCTSTKNLNLTELTFIPRKELFFAIDYSKYSNKEFLITPEKYLGEYYSIGLITYEYLPAGEYKIDAVTENPFYNPTDVNSPQYLVMKSWSFEQVHIEQVMDSVYNICVRMGADALVNFNISPKIETYSSYLLYSNPPTVEGYRITGFAIRREK